MTTIKKTSMFICTRILINDMIKDVKTYHFNYDKERLQFCQNLIHFYINKLNYNYNHIIYTLQTKLPSLFNAIFKNIILKPCKKNQKTCFLHISYINNILRLIIKDANTQSILCIEIILYHQKIIIPLIN